MTRTPRDVWEEIMNRFDPERVPPREWRADRDESPATKIVHALNRQTASPEKVLLLGTVGSGKSTELNRIAEARVQKGDEFVIVFDLVRHFQTVVGDVQALQNISSWEVCFLAGLALIRAAKEQLDFDFAPELRSQLADAWTGLARASQGQNSAPPTVDIFAAIKSLSLMASGAAVPVATALSAPATAGVLAAGGLKVLAELSGAGKWTIPIGRKGTKRLDDQDELMTTLVDKVNLLLGEFQQRNRRVLMIIDGLDRITEIDHAKTLFLHSQMISRLDCALVVCAPFVLRNEKAVTEARVFRLRTLHNVPVLNHQDPQKHGPGVAFLGEVFRRRVKDLNAESYIPQLLLDKLAYYSGGVLRDFVKSIGMLAERGMDYNASVVTAAHVDDVIKEARQLVEIGMHRGDIDVLQEIVKDPDHRLPDGKIARELLTSSRLLPYPNESEWFYPHPLLTLSLVRIS